VYESLKIDVHTAKGIRFTSTLCTVDIFIIHSSGFIFEYLFKLNKVLLYAFVFFKYRF
jgi:hypothetical protein